MIQFLAYFVTLYQLVFTQSVVSGFGVDTAWM